MGCHPVAVHIYTQTIHRTTQITINVQEYGPCHGFACFTLAFALQLRKKHGKNSVRERETSVRLRKTSVRLRKTSVRIQYIYKPYTHKLQNPHKHTHYKTHTNSHITKPTQTHTLQNPHKHKHYKTQTHPHVTKPTQTHTLQNHHKHTHK